MHNLFNVKSIKSNNSLSGFNSLAIQDESYLKIALEYVLNDRNNLINETKNLYYSILESRDNYSLINKSFTEFFNSIITIIDKFIKFIKSLFDKFIIYLNSVFKSDSHIIKNKEKFMDFSTIHEFDMEIFNFSINPNIPIPYASVDYKDDFFEIIDPESIKAAYDRLNNKIRNNFYDKFRATVIGLDGDYIPQADYNDALFRVYRDGELEKSNTTITRQMVYNSIDNFIEFKDLKDQINKTKNKIIKEYEDIKNFILSSISISHASDSMSLGIKNIYTNNNTNLIISADTAGYINLFIKAKTNQLKQMCDIHTLAFASKLDAIKDRYSQDRSILYNSLQKINKHPISEGYSKIAKTDIKSECKKLYDEFVKYVEGKEGISVIDYKFDTIVQRGYRHILEIPIGKYKDGRAAWRTVRDLNDVSTNIKLEPKKKGDNWILRIVLSDPDLYIYEISDRAIVGGEDNEL